MRGLFRGRRWWMLAIGVLAAGLGVTAYATGLFKSLELDSVDARFSVRGTQPPPDDIVVVEVDDVTFDELGVQWPFPRSLHGEVVDKLREAGVRTIAFDVQFTEPTTPKEDNALIRAVRRAGGVVLSTTEVTKDGGTNVFGGDEAVEAARARAANTGLEPDSGGIFRRMHHTIDGLVSFPIAAVENATGEKIAPEDLGEDGEAWIDFRGPPDTLPYVSYSRVVCRPPAPSACSRNAVKRSVADEELRDKIVVIGASAPSLQDIHPTSTTGDQLMPGPELQANAIWTAQHGFPLDDSPGWLDVILIALLGVVPPLITLRLGPVPSLAVSVLLGAVYVVATQLAFNSGEILPLVYPIGALVLATIGAMAVNYVITAFERQRVRDTFARFVPENVVGEVLARADGLRLGGIEREATVMFCDLRGFTSFAESLPPPQVIELLNNYLSGMSDAILDHGGTLVAYMGDGIMAVFGAPIEQDDHADRALAAAREMLTVRLPGFNEWLRSQGFDRGFRMGIGLNAGRVMSGNVGSERRVEYTAVGDTTNTAARIEGMTKGTPHQLFLTESVKERLSAEPEDLVYVDEFPIRGREAKIKVYSITADGAGGEEAESPRAGAVESAS
jgi:adenylate cyclase